MTVYVDNMRAEYGRMKMCHMVADTETELLAMADRIGVARKWRQGRPGWDDHFDIAMSKRALAVAAGAVEVTWKQLACMVARRKHAFTLGVSDFLGDPNTAEEFVRAKYRSSSP